MHVALTYEMIMWSDTSRVEEAMTPSAALEAPLECLQRTSLLIVLREDDDQVIVCQTVETTRGAVDVFTGVFAVPKRSIVMRKKLHIMDDDDDGGNQPASPPGPDPNNRLKSYMEL